MFCLKRKSLKISMIDMDEYAEPQESGAGVGQISNQYSNQRGEGADYARHITTCPLGFLNLPTALVAIGFTLESNHIFFSNTYQTSQKIAGTPEGHRPWQGQSNICMYIYFATYYVNCILSTSKSRGIAYYGDLHLFWDLGT